MCALSFDDCLKYDIRIYFVRLESLDLSSSRVQLQILRCNPDFHFHRQDSVSLIANKVPQAGHSQQISRCIRSAKPWLPLCLSALSLSSCIFCIQLQLFQVGLLPLQLQLLPLLHAEMHVRTLFSPVNAVRYAFNAPVQQYKSTLCH